MKRTTKQAVEMARLRTIKPSFFTNEDLVTVDPLGRLLFIGLWCVADREGRLEDRPARLKIQLLPADDCNVIDLLDQLERNGFIERYEVDGARYINVINFHRHQRPHVKEAPSELPAPTKVVLSTDLGSGEHAPSSVFRLPSSVNRLPSSVNGVLSLDDGTAVPDVHPGETVESTTSTPVGDVADYYEECILPGARLTEKARAKIKTRLKTYSVEELQQAMEKFAGDWWWMENNRRQGMAWFFDSDDRIEKFLGLVPRVKPHHIPSHAEVLWSKPWDNIDPDSVEGRSVAAMNAREAAGDFDEKEDS